MTALILRKSESLVLVHMHFYRRRYLVLSKPLRQGAHGQQVGHRLLGQAVASLEVARHPPTCVLWLLKLLKRGAKGLQGERCLLGDASTLLADKQGANFAFILPPYLHVS